jgi:hypothetical protein
LLNFSPRLVDLIGQLGSALSQPFLDKHFGDQALEPHNEAAVVDIHTHPQHPTTALMTYRKNWLFLETLRLSKKNALYEGNFVRAMLGAAAAVCSIRVRPAIVGMISPKASQRLDNYQCACSSKNRAEKEFTLRQREPTAQGGKRRKRKQLAQARVGPWCFHFAGGSLLGHQPLFSQVKRTG